MKNRMEEVAGKLKLKEVSEKPQSHILVDFITKLPIVAGKDAILVVCDRLLKMTHFVATMKGTTTKGLARLFRDNGNIILTSNLKLKNKKINRDENENK